MAEEREKRSALAADLREAQERLAARLTLELRLDTLVLY